ncbi:putative mitochondrial atpase protein [Botrytis fragariae]|uniref:Putative mitochondrial atpase protein n=1 Tax=Botrytis fragariae TaxID=1964551 RepID=A0A8H6ALC5_9HELO|nr:putative mitochondrial atpase protein [Botrytis fragariae]KAF5869592.1 putative mitochondrial atpase protein [Botrytis fragariae]
MPPTNLPQSTGLTITNPLILYRALLATKVIDPDPAQHRIALHLQKLYLRLKDYKPQSEYAARLKAISQAVNDGQNNEDGRTVAVPGHPLRNNPLFAHLFRRKERQDTLAMTRVLTSHEAAMNLDSPQGILLHGEVGTGKSMLLDMLADSLPNNKKRRWHFNTFMLETFSRLEQLRQSRSKHGNLDSEDYSLLWLAKDMIEKSPILFLDEFQLPDRAASKILSNLLIPFFQLGGVLIASSNRMPEELEKASGMDYAVPGRGGLVKNWLGLAKPQKLDMFSSGNEFSGFVGVLRARCEIWDMGKGGRDWRRREIEDVDDETAKMSEIMREEMIEGFTGLEKLSLGNLGPGSEQNIHERDDDSTSEKILKANTPKKYLLASDSDDTWEKVVKSAFPSSSDPIPWQSTTLLVYGRTVPVARHLNGITYWDFSTLCGGAFGPADYITMASTFHTFIIDDVPILTLLQKNEARRLITLLDALYEARCKLIIRAATGPDTLFFPETKLSPSSDSDSESENPQDAVYPETLAEIYQDQTSPFRPNISTYTDTPSVKTGYDPDEDADFGSVPGAGNEIGRRRGVDFARTESFTGEDERFAYKRAASRLWEMCGGRWHARGGQGDGEAWWRPLSVEARGWERNIGGEVIEDSAVFMGEVKGDVKMGGYVELERPAGLEGKQLEEMEKLGNGTAKR